MFDIGFSELLIVFVVMLIVVGPDKFPSMAKKIGLYVRKARSAFNDIKREVERELDVEELKSQMKSHSIMEDVKDIQKDVEDISKGFNKTLSESLDVKKGHASESDKPAND